MKAINLALVFLSLVGLVSAHADDYGYGMMDGMYHIMSRSYGYSGMLFGWLFGILVLAVLVLLMVWLIKQIQKK